LTGEDERKVTVYDCNVKGLDKINEMKEKLLEYRENPEVRKVANLQTYF
jgi:hypothetical protein